MNVRLARRDEYPKIADFLHREWRPNHIFCQSRKLFDWQHLYGDHYHFVLGIEGERIMGVFGFVPSCQFEPSTGYESIFLCIWKVADEAAGQGLGRRLLDFIEDSYSPTLIATVGASAMTLPMYQKRGWQTGRMEHWFRERSIAMPLDAVASDDDVYPHKNGLHMVRRYTFHPWYKYITVVGVVMRICGGDGVRVLRVVDCLDPAMLKTIYWETLMKDTGTDVAEFYCAGFDSADLEQAGFRRRIGDEIIIPSHFEPYEHRNVEIDYAIKCDRPWRLTRGDGDMDRPNVLP